MRRQPVEERVDREGGPRTAAPGDIGPHAIALLALEIALAYAAAGTHEEGGNNRGDQVEFFQRLMGGAPGDPWCADFVCTCIIKAYARACGLAEDRQNLPHLVQAAASAMTPLSGSCAVMEQGARGRGMWRPAEYAANALPGDLVLFDFGRKGRASHIGMVRSASAREVRTVEGNTSGGATGSQRDGGGVYRRVRTVSTVRGFVHFG